MFRVQTVLYLQPHTLKVSFTTLQLLYQLALQSSIAARQHP